MYVRTGIKPGTDGTLGSYFGEPKPLEEKCPGYEKGEREISHCQTGKCEKGHLNADVIRHPRGLLIADFGVGWSGIKAATKKEKLLKDWMAEVRPNLRSIAIRIYGYSDCVGQEKDNITLRRNRAAAVYALLDKDLQSRVTVVDAGPFKPYIADNKTKEGRANNRGVIIELVRLGQDIPDITDIPCTGPGCPPPPPRQCVPPNCPPPPPPPRKCVPPDCPPPPPPKRPDRPDEPEWKPPRLPLPDLPPRDILDRVKEVLDYLRKNGGDPGLIKKLEGLLAEAAKIVAIAGAVLGLYMFVKGRLVQIAIARGMVLPRILHRFETSGMKKALERILNELTDPKTTEPIKQEIRRTQPRKSSGRFDKKQPGDDPPGSQHEKRVCELVRQRYPYYAEQVRVKRYTKPLGLPGQPPPPGAKLVIADPLAKVDCAGSYSKSGGLVLFEAKDTGPTDFTNPGLTRAQRTVYPALVDMGGEIVVPNGPFATGTILPKPTRVRIITPANINTI